MNIAQRNRFIMIPHAITQKIFEYLVVVIKEYLIAKTHFV